MIYMEDFNSFDFSWQLVLVVFEFFIIGGAISTLIAFLGRVINDVYHWIIEGIDAIKILPYAPTEDEKENCRLKIEFLIIGIDMILGLFVLYCAWRFQRGAIAFLFIMLFFIQQWAIAKWGRKK